MPLYYSFVVGSRPTSNTVFRVPRVHNQMRTPVIYFVVQTSANISRQKILNGAPVGLLASIRHKHRSFTCSFEFFISFLLICLPLFPQQIVGNSYEVTVCQLHVNLCMAMHTGTNTRIFSSVVIICTVLMRAE